MMRNAVAELTACYTIQPGDTATYIALRFTGGAQHRHEPWFQIVDPTGPRLIPKAEYGRIRPGWRTCFPETRLTSQWGHRTGTQAESRGSATTIQSVAGNPPVLLWSGVVVLLMALIAWREACAHLKRRRATARVMQSFAERFISEFERPLRQPGSAACPLEARMRLVLRQRRVDILLAPNGGRSYPNLTDHRRNMTYDVGRVVRQIADTRFTTGDVYAHGRWVVVPCRLTTEPAEEGGT